MRSVQITSFNDLQNLHANHGRADAALALAVGKGNLQGVQAALRSGASPLATVDSSGSNVFLLAAGKPNAEELLCELLNATNGVEDIVDTDAQRLTLVFSEGRALTLEARNDQEKDLLPKLARFLKATQVWKANFPPKDNETNLYSRMREANHRLVEAVRQGNAERVEAALSEGATALALDVDGKSVLVWASEHPNHAQLVGAMLANEPSLDLVNGQFLRNLPNARTSKGGTAAYIPAGPDGVPMTVGHQVVIHPSLVNSTLKAHLNTRDELEAAMADFAQDARQRGLAVQLHWPNTVQFQRLLQERYDASLAAVQD